MKPTLLTDRSLLPIALVVISLGIVGCGSDNPTASTTGSVTLSMTCAVDGCGKTGNLRAQVKTCGPGGAVLASDNSRTGATLSQGTPIAVTLGNVSPGPHCATAFLDVNTNTTRDAGDVIASGVEVAVTVVSGQTTSISLILDTLSP